MINKILEIINKHWTYHLYPKQNQIDLASEIESLIKDNYVEKDFALWMIEHSHGQDFYIGYNASNKLIWYNSLTDAQYTFDKLYRYWLTNIKGK